MSMTSSEGQEEAGSGENRVESADFRKQKRRKEPHDNCSIRTKVHSHFIHGEEASKSIEERVVESLTKKKLPLSATNVAQPLELPKVIPGEVNDSCQMIHQDSLETNIESIENTESSGGIGEDESTDGSDGASDPHDGDTKLGDSKRATKKKAGKIDRTNLRKGKWTVEEEEYTSRIIHHFSTGLLTLPEGTTLRSYLAEKLKCDPMRITKKFAGASCLGKRVFHFCDQTQASAGDIEMAKAELAQLEHRFRLRVEHGQSSVPLPPQMISSTPKSPSLVFAPSPGHPAPAAIAASWLQSLAVQLGVPAPGTAHFPQPLGVPTQYHVNAPAPWTFTPAATHSTAPAQSIAPSPIQVASNEAVHMAWAQAAASLTPALSQLAAANLQQHQQQLQKAFESQLQTYGQQLQTSVPPQSFVHSTRQGSHAPVVLSAPPLPQQIAPASFVMAPPPSISLAMPSNSFMPPPQLSIAPQPSQSSTPAPAPSAVKAVMLPIQPRPALGPPPTRVVVPSPVAQSSVSGTASNAARTKDDVDAGSMLMGFLNSLHKGFIEAKCQRDKEERDSAEQEQAWSNKSSSILGMGDAQETSSGRTSQPADSSLEDSQSEQGGKDPSSSEESDVPMERPRGPPRKRHKTKVSEFTSVNVAAHTSRMDALHNAGLRREEGFLSPHTDGSEGKQ